MTLRFAGNLDRAAVGPAADVVGKLIRSPEVAAAWDHESSCAGMTVGGLAHHLVGQPVNVVALLRADPADGQGAETIEVLEHYARAAWVREDVDGQANRSIREESDREAGAGPEAVAAMLDEARAELDQVLAHPPPIAYIPWQKWALATDDFLVTRLMEMVVHADDLAASVDLPTPEFSDAAVEPVLALLTAIAVRRHGQAALVRTLSRPQRAPASVSAF